MEQNINKIWQAGEIKDFYNHKEAENWAEKDSKFWRENRLKKSEVKSLDELLSDLPTGTMLRAETALYLKKTSGNLLSKDSVEYKVYENEHNVKLEKLNEVIENVDDALARSKLGHGIALYHSFLEDGFAYMGHEFWLISETLNPNKINLTQFRELAARWKGSTRNHNDFLHGSLVKPKFTMENSSVPAFIKFIIPKGHPGAFYPTKHTLNGENVKMILPRGLKYKVNDFRIVTDRTGKERIQIEAHLLNN